MSKVQSSTKRILAAAGVLCLLLCLLCPVPVAAASSSLNSIHITVDLEDNGDGWVTEVWNVTADSADSVTELYITKYNLDEQEISQLSVTDETGKEFENIGTWDSSRSREAKAGQCGLVETHGGYEICWGFGTWGNHEYTIRYYMTNLVKGYDGADALYQWFVSKDLFGPVNDVSVTVRRAGTEFTQQSTGVWGFGCDGEIWVKDGQVELTNTSTLRSSQYVAMLVEFEPGMFNPTIDRQNVTINEIREEALQGSGYTPDEAGTGGDTGTGGGNAGAAGGDGITTGGNDSNGFSISRIFNGFFSLIPRFIFPAFIVFVFVGLFKKGTSQNKGPTITPKQYAEVPYSREIPFKGSLPCTYTRLKDSSRSMGQNEGSIMGAYLLRWVRTKQVELLAQEESGFFKSGSSVGIKLYNPRPDMPPLERSLYDILVAAAGSDWVLQSKELEKYSRKNYQTVERWYNSVKSNASAELRQMGATTVTQQKSFFGLFTSNVDTISEYGNQLTYEMYGFKKYLEDFTIINERQAREVELWDEYLVYAQIFGIAETVAQQFQQLYPKYFTDMQANMGGGMTMYDTITVIRLTNMISRSAYSGYHSGYTAAHTSSYSGGGGGFSGGGGSGGSGGGSSGGGFR